MAQSDLISIDPAQSQAPELISLDVGGSASQVVSSEVAADRSSKAVFGLAPTYTDKNYDQVYDQIASGQEDSFRQEISHNIDFKRQQTLRNRIRELTQLKGAELNPEAIAALVTAYSKPTDPNEVIEDNYARKYVGQLDETADRESTFWHEAKQEIPANVDTLQRLGKDLIKYREYLLKKAAETKDTYENQSYLGWGADQLKAILPGYSDLKLRGSTPGAGFFEGGMLGSNLRAQSVEAFNKPFPEFKAWIDGNMERLQKDNPSLAMTFITSMLGQSTSDEVWNNLTYTGLDIATLPIGGIAKFGLRRAGLLASSKDAVKDVVQSTVTNAPTPVARAAGTGDLAEAGIQKANLNLVADLKGQNINPFQRAIDAIHSIYNKDLAAIKADPGRGGQEIVNRLEQDMVNSERNTIKTLSEVQKVMRTPEVALASEATLRALKQSTQDEYRGLKNGILDLSVPKHEPITNTWSYDVNIGNYRGEYFFNPNVAQNFAKVNGLLDYEVKKKGLGYFIKINRPLDETLPVVRDAFQTTASSTTPNTGLNAWFNAFLGRFRTPEETLSLDQRKNRHAATYATSVVLDLANKELAEVKKLRAWAFPGTSKRQQWNEWKDVITRARDLNDSITGDKGYFFRGVGELEDHYQRYVNRMPDPQEVRAYFAYTRFVELDRELRNIAVYRNKSRLGVEQHRIALLDKEGNKVYSDLFDGIRMKEMPKTDDRVLLSIGQEQGSEKLLWGDKIYTQLKNKLEQGVKEGRYQVIRVFDPESRPFNAFSKIAEKENARIRYIITDKAETRGLPFDQVPRRGGGHFDFDYEHYIKQARIVPETRGAGFRHWYEGDSTLMPILNRAMGEKLLPFLNEARAHIQAGRMAEARALVESKLPIEWKEFQSWFNPKKVNGVLQSARFNVTEPFQIAPKNRLLGDIDNTLASRYPNTFENGTRRGSDARMNQVQYTGERDSDIVKTIVDKGTQGNPVWAYEPAKLVDPVTSIDRAMTRIINSNFMDDYKIFAVEHWLKEAQQYLKLNDIKELWHSPFWHFLNAGQKEAFNPGAPAEIVNRLMTQRIQIQQFLGVPSTTDTILHSAAQRLSDVIYSKYGPTRIDPSWALPYLSDPFRFLRAVTFHAKLGVFAIPQLMVQSQTYATIWAVSGARNAGPGTIAAFLTQLSRINKNPAVLDGLDKVASKLGWKAGQFKEALSEGQRTGFFNVGGEYALRDSALNPPVIQSGASKFFNWGTVFFTEGERNVRYGAWYTAFKEWRTKNPTGRITDAERQEILTRADLMYVNMSRASSSVLHQGVFSIPTQFLSYQMRAAELFTGKRLTNMERTRMLAWNAGLYGVPMAAGVTGFPFGDFIRKSALDHGYTVGDNWVTSTVMEGLPSMLMALATGHGDIQKGNFYNIGERYGIQGFETLREALRSDKTMWDILGGAAFSTFSNTWERLDGFTNGMMSLIRDDDKYFKLKPDDFIDIFKEASGVNNNWRMAMALNTGRWLSKKGVYLDNVSPANAIFMSVSGLQSQAVSDLNLMSWLHKDQQALEKYGLQKFTEEFRKGIRERNANPTQSTEYFKRALAYLNITGYPQDKRGAAIALASKDNESLINQMNWSFFQGAPDARKAQRLEQFRSKQKMNDLKGQ